MTIRKLLTLTVCTALLGCSDDPEQTQQVPPTTGFGNRLSGLTAIIPEAGVTDKSSTTRTGAAETGATVWLVDDAITVTDGLHAGTFDVATGIGHRNRKIQRFARFRTNAPLRRLSCRKRHERLYGSGRHRHPSRTPGPQAPTTS